jgi:predicted RNA methylase
MEDRAGFVVMELFDTELIGEGLLPSMRHAYKHLLKARRIFSTIQNPFFERKFQINSS